MLLNKKLVFLLVCMLACTVCLSALAVEYTTVNNLFTITYDENLYLLDDFTYLNENTSDYQWLYMLYLPEKDVVVDVEMEYMPEFEGVTLYTASEATYAQYVDATLDLFSDYHIQLLDTITVSEQNIPFYIYSKEDADGAYITAETIVNGWAIQFSTYHNESGEMDASLLTVVQEIVSTFKPVIP